MDGNLKKLKGNDGQYILPITHPAAVIDETGKNLNQKLEEMEGVEGKSAYQIWLGLGNRGSESDFIASLKGPKGDNGTGGGVLADSELRQWEVKPLYIPSACGYYEHYHPSVVYIANGWNGYKYWMAETPYPHYSSETGEPWENPHIFCSNDGLNWIVPNGLVNPIDEKISAGYTFMSDTHLVFIPGTQTLECWYRGSAGTTDIIRKTSTDGVNWSPREIMIRESDSTSSGISTRIVSPAIIHRNNKYYMWWVANGVGIYYAESIDGKVWTNITLCTLTGLTNPNIWHLDCMYASSNKYYLTGYSRTGHLYIYEGTNGTSFTYRKTALASSWAKGKDFFASNLYRGCLVECGRKDNSPFYRMYFSGHNETYKYAGVGVMEGKLDTLSHISGELNLQKQGFMKGLEVVNTRVNKADIQLADTGERIGFDYETKEPYFQKADGTKIYFTR